MSHVAKITVEIKDLDALKAACARLGFEWRDGQRNYAWWGQSVGDYPLPQGFTADDLGKCDHAIHVPGAAYEVGVVARRDGRPGFELLWDFFPTGGLEEKLGLNGNKLVQAYGVEAAKRAARRQGYDVMEQEQADGSIVLRVRTGA